MRILKRILLVIGVILAVLILAAAIFLFRPANVTTSEDFSMVVDPDTVTPTGASFIVTNNLDSMPSFGTDYHIEKKGLLGWHKLMTQDLIVFSTGSAHALMPHAEGSIPKDWTYLYGPLPRGTYRLVMEFTNMETRVSCYLGAEFTIP